jgi:hypothetical protein
VSSPGAIRAPRADGAVVAVPPLEQAGSLLAANLLRLEAQAERQTILGRHFVSLRRQARQQAVTAACHYLLERGEPLPAGVEPDRAPERILAAGHQPELFHPGVWIKNFALAGLARRHRAWSLNLIVDNDTVKTTALRLPARRSAAASPRAVELRWVPFDRWNGGGPYEEHRIAEPELFASFADRAGRLLGAWGYQPLLPEFWEEVCRQSRRTPILGDCLAAARRAWERRWGCHNLEVPLSLVCQTEAFAWFACSILAGLPRFVTLHNSIVKAYRAAHGIRGHNHPVPDLAWEGDWLEAPFWAWKAAQQRRERLFVRIQSDRLELRFGQQAGPVLPDLHEGSIAQAVNAWQDLAKQGYKVRTRALTTTLYARLFLGDLFLHGIGGGKYDELTDAIIRRYFGWEPPAFVILSGTRLLPLPRAAAGTWEVPELTQLLRDMHHNPQRHPEQLSEADGQWHELARQKREWIERQPPADAEHRQERRQRYEVLRQLSAQLRGPLGPRVEQLRAELAQRRLAQADKALLQRRDYSFCLYPESSLRPFCTQMLLAD